MNTQLSFFKVFVTEMQVEDDLKIYHIYTLILDGIYIDCLQADKHKMYW